MIFFDIGATLIAGPAQTPARFLAARLALDEADRRRLDRRLLTTRIEHPSVLAAVLSAEFGVADPQTAAEAAQAAWLTQRESAGREGEWAGAGKGGGGPRPVPGARALLAELRRCGQRYGFVSNIWHPYFESFCRLFGPLAEGAPVWLSFREGVAKPAPDLYIRALKAVSAPAGGCVMVGDSYDNDIAPAVGLGMKTVWLLHRAAHEQRFLEGVDGGRLPAPDVTLDGIEALTAATLAALCAPRSGSP